MGLTLFAIAVVVAGVAATVHVLRAEPSAPEFLPIPAEPLAQLPPPGDVEVIELGGQTFVRVALKLPAGCTLESALAPSGQKLGAFPLDKTFTIAGPEAVRRATMTHETRRLLARVASVGGRCVDGALILPAADWLGVKHMRQLAQRVRDALDWDLADALPRLEEIALTSSWPGLREGACRALLSSRGGLAHREALLAGRHATVRMMAASVDPVDHRILLDVAETGTRVSVRRPALEALARTRPEAIGEVVDRLRNLFFRVASGLTITLLDTLAALGAKLPVADLLLRWSSVNQLAREAIAARVANAPLEEVGAYVKEQPDQLVGLCRALALHGQPQHIPILVAAPGRTPAYATLARAAAEAIAAIRERHAVPGALAVVETSEGGLELLDSFEGGLSPVQGAAGVRTT